MSARRPVTPSTPSRPGTAVSRPKSRGVENLHSSTTGKRLALPTASAASSRPQTPLSPARPVPARKPITAPTPAALVSQKKSEYFAKLYFNAAAEGNLQVRSCGLAAEGRGSACNTGEGRRGRRN